MLLTQENSNTLPQNLEKAGQTQGFKTVAVVGLGYVVRPE